MPSTVLTVTRMRRPSCAPRRAVRGEARARKGWNSASHVCGVAVRGAEEVGDVLQAIAPREELHTLRGGVDPLAEGVRRFNHVIWVVRIKSAEKGREIRVAAVEKLGTLASVARLVELDQQQAVAVLDAGRGHADVVRQVLPAEEEGVRFAAAGTATGNACHHVLRRRRRGHGHCDALPAQHVPHNKVHVDAGHGACLIRSGKAAGIFFLGMELGEQDLFADGTPAIKGARVEGRIEPDDDALAKTRRVLTKVSPNPPASAVRGPRSHFAPCRRRRRSIAPFGRRARRDPRPCRS